MISAQALKNIKAYDIASIRKLGSQSLSACPESLTVIRPKLNSSLEEGHPKMTSVIFSFQSSSCLLFHNYSHHPILHAFQIFVFVYPKLNATFAICMRAHTAQTQHTNTIMAMRWLRSVLPHSIIDFSEPSSFSWSFIKWHTEKPFSTLFY